MHRFIILLALTAALFTSSGLAADRAPDFALPDVNGDKLRLYDRLKDGPILVDFWATWCKPCIQELPMLDEIFKTYSPQGLQVWAISTDNPRSSSKVKPFTRGEGFQFTVLMDTDLEVRKLFGGTAMPLTVLIAPSGEIAYQHLGYVPGDEKLLTEQVVNLFNSLKAAKVKEEPAPESNPGEDR